MRLCFEHEIARSNLMSKVPSPSLDDCLNELLHEQAHLEQKIIDSTIVVAYSTQGKPPPRDLSMVQCYNYKKFGHYASQCQQKSCTYCKGAGHIITECRKRPQN